MTKDTDIVAARRARLLDWLNSRFDGNQAAMVRATQINQGELSSLLKSKSFGEKRAASIEAAAKMPAGYLVNPLAPPRVAEPPPAYGKGETRLRQAEDALDALTFALTATLRTVAAQAPELGRALQLSLGALKGSSGSQKQVLAGLTGAVAQGLESWVSASPRAAPAVSPGKQSRKGQ